MKWPVCVRCEMEHNPLRGCLPEGLRLELGGGNDGGKKKFDRAEHMRRVQREWKERQKGM